MDPKDLKLEQTTEKLFEEFKRWWHRQAWKNEEAILLKITKPIIPRSWEELFYSFLQHKYADEISVVSHDEWTKGYVRKLKKYEDRVKRMAKIATNNPTSRVEIKYEIKPPRWKGRQPRAKIQFDLYEGRIISTQVEIGRDPEGSISQLFTISPPSISGAIKPYHALWVPDDYKTKIYLPPSIEKRRRPGLNTSIHPF